MGLSDCPSIDPGVHQSLRLIEHPVVFLNNRINNEHVKQKGNILTIDTYNR